MPPTRSSSPKLICREFEPATHDRSAGAARTVTFTGPPPRLCVATYFQSVGSSWKAQPPVLLPRVFVIALHMVSKRTSVAEFAKSISNRALPAPGRNWTSITFMLGGKSTWSGGYMSCGIAPCPVHIGGETPPGGGNATQPGHGMITGFPGVPQLGSVGSHAPPASVSG